MKKIFILVAFLFLSASSFCSDNLGPVEPSTTTDEWFLGPVEPNSENF